MRVWFPLDHRAIDTTTVGGRLGFHVFGALMKRLKAKGFVYETAVNDNAFFNSNVYDDLTASKQGVT